MYVAKMNSYVHNHNYPIRKYFDKKSTAITYVKRALRIYPYVVITLVKLKSVGYGKVLKSYYKTETWKMVRNKRGGLSPRMVK